MSELFGTDGIRARAGEYPLDPATIYRLGRSLPRSGYRRVLIGRDTRISGLWIEALLAQGIASAGGAVTRAGVISTPGIGFLTRRNDFDAGIVVSASHNPYWDNGVKVISGEGIKLSDAEEEELERQVLHDSTNPPPVEFQDPGRRQVRGFDAAMMGQYIDFLVQGFSPHALASLKVVLDCAHGAACGSSGDAFRRLGAEVIELSIDPDGRNINRECGALHPEAMARAVVDQKADLGVAFDGDADRAIFADADGIVRDGDFILYLLARDLKDKGEIKSGQVVSTVMANIGLELALKEAGLSLLRTQVGDRYVLQAMLEGGHELGGEQSGHVIVRERSLAGDGVLTALLVADVMVRRTLPLSELCRGLKKFPQVLFNVPVREKRDFSGIPEIQQAIDQAGERLGERGRVIVRYSGTEPLARVMLEGEREEEIRSLATGIVQQFESCLGAGPRQ